MTDRSKKITELPAASSAVANDLIVAVTNTSSNAVTKKITVGAFFSNVVANTKFSNTVTFGSNVAFSGTISVGGVASIAANGAWVGNNTGLKGEVGSKGDKGEIGTTGSKGDKGQYGEKGELGVTGTTGSTGSKGDKGEIGTTGSKGDLGTAGAKGDKGEAGAAASIGDITITGTTIKPTANNTNLNLSVRQVDLGASPAIDSVHSIIINTDGNVVFPRSIIFANTTIVPTSASSAGTLGEVLVDGNYIYVCVATNTWKRSALSTW